jgi:hypothetical protein
MNIRFYLGANLFRCHTLISPCLPRSDRFSGLEPFLVLLAKGTLPDTKENTSQDPKSNLAHYLCHIVEVRPLISEPLKTKGSFEITQRLSQRCSLRIWLPCDATTQALFILGCAEEAAETTKRHLQAELELLTSKAITYCRSEIIPRLPMYVGGLVYVELQDLDGGLLTEMLYLPPC